MLMAALQVKIFSNFNTESAPNVGGCSNVNVSGTIRLVRLEAIERSALQGTEDNAKKSSLRLRDHASVLVNI